MDGVWLTGTSLPVARTGFGCVAIGKKIYCIGGSSKRWDMDAVDTMLIYDTETGISSYGTSMPTARSSFGCVVIDNKIYCYGGYNKAPLTTLEIYDVLTDTWNSGQALPVAMRHMASAAVNGEAYAINSSTTYILQKTYKYNPGLDTWSEASTCQVDSILYGAALDGKIYATGGNNQNVTVINKKLFIYDALADTWSEGAEMDSGTTGPSVVADKGKVYCISGMSAPTGAGSSSMNNLMRIYDIASDSWSYGPQLPTPRWDSRAVIVDGKIYCIGGDKNASEAYTTVEIFTLEEDPEIPEVPAGNCCCCTKVEIKITTCSKNQDLLNDINDALILDGQKKDCKCCKCKMQKCN